MKVENLVFKIGIFYLWFGWAWTVSFVLSQNADWTRQGFKKLIRQSIINILTWPVMMWRAWRRWRKP